MTVFVSADLRNYIHRLVLAADNLAGCDQSKRCQTARVLDAAAELENLAKMKAASLGQTYASPDDVKAMAPYVMARRHFGTLPAEILAEVPILQATKTWSAPAFATDEAGPAVLTVQIYFDTVRSRSGSAVSEPRS